MRRLINLSNYAGATTLRLDIPDFEMEALGRLCGKAKCANAEL